MILLRTNDAVLISYVEALLADAGIGFSLIDSHMSALEGSIGVLPRRLDVAADDWPEAAEVMQAAGLAQWVERHAL